MSRKTERPPAGEPGSRPNANTFAGPNDTPESLVVAALLYVLRKMIDVVHAVYLASGRAQDWCYERQVDIETARFRHGRDR